MSESMTKYYKILEIESGATLDDVKAAYRQMSQVWHPDRFNKSPSLLPKATEHMKEINLAYEKLQQHIAEKNRQAGLRAYESGIGHFTARRYEKAVEYFTKTTEVIPDHVEAFYWMAQAFYQLRYFAAAMPCLDKAKKLNPRGARIRYAIGVNYFESGSFRLACDALLECLALDPDNIEAWCKSGAALAERGDWESAIYMYAEAVKREPTHFDIIVRLALTYRKSGNLDAALHWLERAVKVSTNDVFKKGYTENLLHDLRRQIEEREEAETYRQEQSHTPEYDEARV